MILSAFWSPLQSQINPFSPKKLQIPLGISCQKLIDITHMRSWHSCLLSSETLAPFLEFPREWPSFSLQRVWVKISQEVDCSDLEKQQVYWEECRVSNKSQNDTWLPGSQRFLSSVCVYRCGRVVIPQAVIWTRPSCAPKDVWLKHKNVSKTCLQNTQASLIAKINLLNGGSAFFESRIQNAFKSKAKILCSLS